MRPSCSFQSWLFKTLVSRVFILFLSAHQRLCPSVSSSFINSIQHPRTAGLLFPKSQLPLFWYSFSSLPTLKFLMGTYNYRNPAPNITSNSDTNGPIPPLGPQPFINIPNHFVPVQNNQMGFPLLAPVMFPGQSFPGFLPQANAPNMNNLAVFPTNNPFGRMSNFSQMSLSQPAAQFQNMPAFAQLMNQSMCIPNAQFGMQNMNQFCAMQMTNHGQLGSFNVPASHQMMRPSNQVNLGRDSQNPAFFRSPLYGAACSADGGRNQINLTQPSTEQKELTDAPEQLEHNSPLPCNPHSAHEGQAPEIMQFFKGNSASNGQSNVSNSWKFSTNNFQGRPRKGRWENPKFMSAKNNKRKFDGSRDAENRGGINRRQKNNNNTSLSNQDSPRQKRSVSLSYTEQEVQQWRDQRRKNHPSRANKDELHEKKLTGDGSIEKEERIRRQQLKEILAKQAELGVEVADVPAHYLLDSGSQPHEGKSNEADLPTKERAQNRRNRNGRIKSKLQFAKRQRITNNESSNRPSTRCREPTLLQKLLSADIKRDRQHLLQVFRFMVMNNYFKNALDKPLVYPVAFIKDTKCESPTAKEEASLATSASVPGVHSRVDFVAQECDKDSHGESKAGNQYCGEEVISAEEEGEITSEY
uniref:FMR1-interacting protein 1 conserved domain-containing protein n=1 Tax=Kalanchoe fedtschenkoi TaxID=63787 RepID=A0A7N0ZRG9_KALFE